MVFEKVTTIDDGINIGTGDTSYLYALVFPTATKTIQDEIERRRFIPPQGYTSLSWYNELRKRAESGDEEAIKILTPP